MQTASRHVRFGVFELDTQSRELRKNGLKLHFAEQPFQILHLLIERAPSVVTREELREKLWSDDTFVDFDHGLNAAIKRLREALCDSADHPRYIETLPRRGYRFICPLDCEELDPNRVAPTKDRHVIPIRRPPPWWLYLMLLAVGAAVILVGQKLYRGLARPRPGLIRSIAVLPFDCLYETQSKDYFCESVTDALIGELGRIRSLRVISRHSVMQYKGTTKPIPQIAKELKVDAILEGTGVRDGNYVRISVQLIRGDPEEHLWARSYQRELKDILMLQSELTRAIANEINLQLTPDELSRVTRRSTVNPAAYDAYLQGLYRLNRWDVPMEEAIQYFQQAIDTDPTYAPAYVGLAEAYMMMPLLASMSPKEAIPRAEEALAAAMALDPDEADAYRIIGRIRTYHFDWVGAEESYKHAIELNPSSARLHAVYGWYLTWVGRFDDSSRELRTALDNDQRSLYAIRALGMNYLCQHQYDQALQRFREAQALEPENMTPNADLGRLYILMGKFPEAVAQLDRARRMSGRATGGSASPDGYLGMAYALAGQRTEAMKILNELAERSMHNYVSPLSIALIYVGLNDKTHALDWLEKGMDAQDGDLVLLNVYPLWDPIRTEHRFQRLIGQLNMPSPKEQTALRH